MSEATEAQNEAVDSAGAMLHAERRRQSLSVGDVSRHLKLSIRQVEALERDDYHAFGGPVFVHGFLRNYAKLLGLDAALLIGAADRKLAFEAARSRPEPERSIEVPLEDTVDGARKSVMPLFLAAAILVAGVAAWMYMQQDKPDVNGVISSQYPNALNSGTEDDVALLTEPGADVVADPRQDAVAPRPDTATARDTGRRDPQVNQGRVQLGFREESWVEVTDRYGEIIFAELVPQGVARLITGAAPLSVVIGNATGVDLVYNGKPISLALHTRVDVARLTLE